MAEPATFYDTHGVDFSKSRFRVWPQVREFLDALPHGAKVLDIGCGNGKNMLAARADLSVTGCEPSRTLCEICAERGLNVVQGDARQLPFKDASFDAVIMIAVIHHIHPREHNQPLFEIQRVLKPGGKALITNWAVEQPVGARRSFHVGLNLVSWKGKEMEPLPYWVMDRETAEAFVRSLPHELICESLVCVAGNWTFVIGRGGQSPPLKPPLDKYLN